MIRSLNGKNPIIPDSSFIAPSADIIGDVRLGFNSSIWYQCVLRGDVMPITIGDESNIQDGTIIHGTWKQAEAIIGNKVTVGHKCVLHGCKIDDLVLVGMGSVVMDNVHVEKNCFIGAGSVLTQNKHFPEGSLIMGSPARVVRPLKQKELDFLPQSAKNYIEYKSWYVSNEKEK